MGMLIVVVGSYCDGSRWRFDSSNTRELWTVTDGYAATNLL